MADKNPNILIFMTDQQQGSTVLPEHPCYTPNLDRLASEGVTFTNVLCPSPHCCPARASFMSGIYPSRHGVFNNVNTQTAIHHGLNPDVTLFSEELRDAGYQLAYSGKWHVSRDEGAEDRGWVNLAGESRKGADAVRNRRNPDVWKSEKEDLKANHPRRRGEVMRPGWGNRLLYGSVPAKGPNGYEETGDHRIVQRALAGLSDLTAGDDPWCLFIGVGGPHDAFIIPENYARMYDPELVELPPSFHDTLEDKPRIYQRMRHNTGGS